MSQVIFFSLKGLQLVGGGSDINGAYPFLVYWYLAEKHDEAGHLMEKKYEGIVIMKNVSEQKISVFFYTF